MTTPARSTARDALGQAYSSALDDFLAGAGESALSRAYELGRDAAGHGINLLEVAMIHHLALAELMEAKSARRELLTLASQFFAEILSPFEVTLRAYQANARLLGLIETQALRNDEIDRAREQLRTILDATTAVIYLKDAEDRFLFVNRQFQSVFGLSREQTIGRRPADVLPGPIANTMSDNDRRVLAGDGPREVEENFSIDGVVHTYISLKFPLADAVVGSYAICCVATDITERKRAAEELKQAKAATEAANRDLESFSYSVAHDLRAPLRSIDGFSAQLLAEHSERLDAEGQKYLGYVRQSSVRMAELIDGLLALSRVGRGEIRHEIVDMSQLVAEIALRLREREPERDVTFDIQDNAQAWGDRRLIGALLENLVGNAWKFTQQRRSARIEFSQEKRDREWVTAVRDNGAGFDMSYAEKLFGVFQRLHTVEEFDGTGIGLATVKRIVQRHGGRVWAQGVVDQGATFQFTLPTIEDAS